MKRWLRYGLVGNFLTYGIGYGFIFYTGIFIPIQHGSSMTQVNIKAQKWMKILQKNSLRLVMLTSKKVQEKQNSNFYNKNKQNLKNKENVHKISQIKGNVANISDDSLPV